MSDTYSRITSKFIPSSDGALIYAEATGNPSKPAIVLVPGYTLSVQVFDKQFKDSEMQRELYMIRYDPRGHGQSAMPETEEGHASKLYADDFAVVCKAFGVVRPVYVGWSLAGAIITDICAHLGASAISAAVLIAGLPHLSPTMLSQILSPHLSALLPGVNSLDDTTLYKCKMLEFGDSLFLDPKSVPFAIKCAWLGTSMFQPPVVTRLVVERRQDEGKLYDALRAGLKVMFMHGNQDVHRPSGLTVVDAVREHLRDYRVVEISNAGHASFYDNVKETNEVLIAYAREISAV